MNHQTDYDHLLHLKDWMKATFLGWLLGFIVVIILAVGGETVGMPNSQSFVGIGIGAGVGYMQNRLLRRLYGVNWNWMWATIIGMGLSFILFDLYLAELIDPESYHVEYPVALGGLFCGILQYTVLKKRFGTGIIWILISFLAWSSAALMAISTPLLDQLGLNNLVSAALVLIILVLATSLLLGSISGMGLKLILKKAY